MGTLDVLRGKDRLAVEAFLRATREALGHELREIRLYGSKVRGTDFPDSDIDVFVVVGKRTPAIVDRITDLAFDANLAYDVYISPRVVGEATLSDPLWMATPFLKAVTREGIVI